MTFRQLWDDRKAVIITVGVVFVLIAGVYFLRHNKPTVFHLNPGGYETTHSEISLDDFFRVARKVQAQEFSDVTLPTQDNPATANLVGPDGKLTDIQPTIVASLANINVSLPKPKRVLMPG